MGKEVKYYAVKKGRQIGIFLTWEECKRHTHGYSGAVFQSFPSLQEAKVWLYGAEDSVKTVPNPECMPYAYVDGSYCDGIYGYGGFIVANGKEYELMGNGIDEDLASMRNVAGEIMGAMAAVEKAIELGLTDLIIFYDYTGIEQWATGAWKRNRNATENYYRYMKKAGEKLTIHYRKVKGHTGIIGNERADQLAKMASGAIM